MKLKTACKLGLPEDVMDLSGKFPDDNRTPFRVSFMIHPHAKNLDATFESIGTGVACGWACRSTDEQGYDAWKGKEATPHDGETTPQRTRSISRRTLSDETNPVGACSSTT